MEYPTTNAPVLDEENIIFLDAPPLPPPYMLWWIVTDDEKRKATEEMLKGQAFGL